MAQQPLSRKQAITRFVMEKFHKNYEETLKILDLKTLKGRRIQLCLKFAKKMAGNEKNRQLLPLLKK